DVRMIGDSGGKAPQWAKGVSGANNVARTIGAISSLFFQIGGTIEKHVVNGQTGAILRDRDGKVLNTWTLDVLDGQVQTIRTVLNPDKLAHMGPVADAWALLREANQARRPQN
ncbi:MAG: polymerase, sigma-24 subunit, subfamily, partial [Microbacteriaceae bacterium]|nr:polymerase, sigma-24 subunit, subfamily [Microbacteriaceae bacterium]